MQWRTYCFILACLAAATLLGSACGNPEADRTSAQAAEVASLEEAKRELDAKRARLAEMEAAAAGQQATAGDDEAPPANPEIPALRADVDRMSEEVGGRIVEFLNNSALVAGESATETQRAVIRLKSDEDLRIAQEYINEGGDYRRAMEIYEMQLQLDPENPELQAALEKAQEMRFMTEERFSQVKVGMTQDEVRALLGQVYLRNVRQFPERDVVGWFYPKEEGGAAGVYFREKDSEVRVYETDYDAVKTQEAG